VPLGVLAVEESAAVCAACTADGNNDGNEADCDWVAYRAAILPNDDDDNDDDFITDNR
jgi:hypothetical protein